MTAETIESYLKERDNIYRMYDSEGDYLFYTVDEKGEKNKIHADPQTKLPIVIDTLSEREGRRRRCREPQGLDQYLGLRKYVSKYNYPIGYTARTHRTDAGPFGVHQPVPSRQQWPLPINPEYADISAFAFSDSDKYSDFSGVEMRFPVGYWRNANAIHFWFVNLCGGYDKRQIIFASPADLKRLRSSCEKVLAVRTQEEAEKQGLFPTPGTKWATEMDDWYFDDLERTVEMLNHIFKYLPEDEDITFIYDASW